MADLASSAVTVVSKRRLADFTGKERYVRLRVTAVLTGQGSTTNKIPATALGLSSIDNVSGFVTDGNTMFVAAPSYDGANVLLANLAQATDANRPNSADLTDTVRFTVEGIEA